MGFGTARLWLKDHPDGADESNVDSLAGRFAAYAPCNAPPQAEDDEEADLDALNRVLAEEGQ